MRTQPEPCVPLADGWLKLSADPGLAPILSPWALTTPFSTQKPSWYLESGRRMTAVVTGGQCTMFSITSVWCFSSWKMGWGFCQTLESYSAWLRGATQPCCSREG